MSLKLPSDVTLVNAVDMAEVMGSALVTLLCPLETFVANAMQGVQDGIFVTHEGNNYIVTANIYPEEVKFIRTEMLLPHGTLVKVQNGTKITVDLAKLSVDALGKDIFSK